MMTDVPTLPKLESTPAKKDPDSSDDSIDIAMDSEEESDEESKISVHEADFEGLEEPYGATSSSSFSSEKIKTVPPDYTVDDVRYLPPPPKGIPSNAKPYYYSLERVKVKKDEAQAKLDRIREKTERAKKQYEALCNRLAKRESEVAILESQVNARSDAFFEARLEEDDEWNTMYKQLRAFREEHGDLNLEKDDNPDLHQLIIWVRKQRDTKRRGTIKPFREAALERLDFPWKPKDDMWNEKYNELVSYKKTHGHVLVDKDENPDLSDWVKQQQNRLQKRFKHDNVAELLSGHDHLLLDIGLKVHVGEMRWELNYDAIIEYMNTHGDFPPTKDQLGSWVARQKKEYFNYKEGKKSKLTAEQVSKLDKLEFVEEPRRADAWKDRFDELARYKQEHGRWPPIQRSQIRTKLGAWVSSQRSHYKYFTEGKPHILTAERIEMLNGIGFQWSVGNAVPKKSWHERYEELVAYYTEHGHCRVSIADRENYSLAKWVKRQRESYWAMKEGRAAKTGSMTQEKAGMLEAIGFSWQVRSRRNCPDKKADSPI